MSAEAPPRAPEEPARRGSWRSLLGLPMVGVHAFAIAAAVTCVVAGSWQFEAYRLEQAAERADRSGAVPVPLDEVLTADDALRGDLVGRRVVASGEYAPAADQLLVAGREHGGEVGWWVLSPLLTDDDTALLVVRGWTGEPTLPAPPAGRVTVTASLQPGEDASTGARATPEPGDPVVDIVRLQSLVNVLPYRVYPAYGIRTAEAPAPADSLRQVTAPGPEPSWTTGSRNLAYALQWWLFAGFTLFMWWRVVADRLQRSPAPEAGTSTS